VGIPGFEPGLNGPKPLIIIAQINSRLDHIPFKFVKFSVLINLATWSFLYKALLSWFALTKSNPILLAVS